MRSRCEGGLDHRARGLGLFLRGDSPFYWLFNVQGDAVLLGHGGLVNQQVAIAFQAQVAKGPGSYPACTENSVVDGEKRHLKLTFTAVAYDLCEGRIKHGSPPPPPRLRFHPDAPELG
jgi:hypothetical protein